MTRANDTSARGMLTGLKATRRRIRSTRAGRLALQAIVAALGLAVIAVGIVLLPLPGPGWLIIFAGLGILSSEFEWAARLLRYARQRLTAWTNWLGAQGRGMKTLIGFAGLVVLAAVFGAAWWFYAG